MGVGSCGAWTRDPQVKSLMLWPTELKSHRIFLRKIRYRWWELNPCVCATLPLKGSTLTNSVTPACLTVYHHVIYCQKLGPCRVWTYDFPVFVSRLTARRSTNWAKGPSLLLFVSNEWPPGYEPSALTTAPRSRFSSLESYRKEYIHHTPKP